MLRALQQTPCALRFASARLLEDRAFVVEAVRKRGACLECCPERFRSDREVVIEAVTSDRAALAFASEDRQGRSDALVCRVGFRPQDLARGPSVDPGGPEPRSAPAQDRGALHRPRIGPLVPKSQPCIGPVSASGRPQVGIDVSGSPASPLEGFGSVPATSAQHGG